MSRRSTRIFVLLASAVLILILSELGGISIRSLASVQKDRLLAASEDLASPSDTATDSNASQDKENLPVSAKAMLNSYTVCQYYFCHSDQTIKWEMGKALDALEQLSEEVNVYLDGPEGHVENYLSLPVDWDLSNVDISKEGTYSVIGILDISSCEYPVNWAGEPLPTIIIEIYEGGVLSFQPDLKDDTLRLKYTMNGMPFHYSEIDMYVFESLDDGANWKNISHSKRVQIQEDQLIISGITSDSMFQAIYLSLPVPYAGCSDIVKLEVLSGAPFVSIISSEGNQGGESWGEENWDLDFVLDGPYQILGYGVLNARIRGLESEVIIGDEIPDFKSIYDSINIYFGEEELWSDRLDYLFPVQWDWTPLDFVDWNQPGKTYIYGHFSESDMADCSPELDFRHMPELVITITVCMYQEAINLYTEQENLLSDNTIQFHITEHNDEPISFDDTLGLTLWCSPDKQKNWYNISSASNVIISIDTITVSHLNNKQLKDQGYTFQLEQSLNSDYKSYTTPLLVSHGIYGLIFDPDIGGERGGEKRHEKPPEGLFDTSVTEKPGEPETSAPETNPDSSETAGNLGKQPDKDSNSSDTITMPETSQSQPADMEAIPVPSADSHMPGKSEYEDLDAAKGNHTKDKESKGEDMKNQKSNKPESMNRESINQENTNQAEDRTSGKPATEVVAPAPASTPSDTASRRKAFRIAISLSAVAAGGIAGFLMIRRR